VSAARRWRVPVLTARDAAPDYREIVGHPAPTAFRALRHLRLLHEAFALLRSTFPKQHPN
jgi:hypothetical protein